MVKSSEEIELEEFLQEEIEIPKEENINKEEHFEIIQKINSLGKDFNELDNYFENLSSYQSETDEYLSDLLHYVETHSFTQASALKFVNLLKEKRIKRRQLKNEYEIKRVFDTGRQRFAMYNQREIFLSSIYKKEKELSYPYKYRQVSDEEIDKLIGNKKRIKS